MDTAEAPPRFREALASLAAAHTRAEVRLVETPAPQRIAPFAIAINGTVMPEELDTSGRFVLLHEPGGNDAWQGDFRIIALVKARVEPEIGADDVWADAVWSWIADALEDLPHHSLGGTVTKVINRSFGHLSSRDDEVSVEMRVSWTPETSDAGAHIAAWTELLALCAGIPPTPEGVAVLPGGRA
jgi:hypothetical protein